MSYLVNQAVKTNLQLYNADTLELLSGKLLADFKNVSLKRDGTVDCTLLVSVTEIGVTGEYVIAFTPIVAGHYSLIFTEPDGSLGYNRSFTFEVLSTDAAVAPSSDLYNIVLSNIKVKVAATQAPLTPDDVYYAINSAILGAFSRLNPKRCSADIIGDGATKIYNLKDVLGSWSDSLSEIVSLEYPLDQTPATFLVQDVDYSVHPAEYAKGSTIRFFTAIPLNDVVNIIYYGVHSQDGSDLSEYEKRQVSFLAAGYCLEKVASYYLGQQNIAVGDAVAELRSRSDEAAARAKEYMGLFYSFWGVDGKNLGAASASAPVYIRQSMVEPASNKTFRFTHKY